MPSGTVHCIPFHCNSTSKSEHFDVRRAFSNAMTQQNKHNNQTCQTKLRSHLQDADARSSSDGSGDEVDQRRLQLYERSRLRYYYAVVDCKDVRTAAHLYAECDGIEFLRSACKLDMRFVPDDQVRHVTCLHVLHDCILLFDVATAFPRTHSSHQHAPTQEHHCSLNAMLCSLWYVLTAREFACQKYAIMSTGM